MKNRGVFSVLRSTIVLVSFLQCVVLSSVQAAKRDAPKVADSVAEISEALELPHQGPRIIALVRAIDRVSPRNIAKVAAGLDKQYREHAASRDLALVLLPKWVAVDPQGAIAATLEVSKSYWVDPRIRQIFELWAADDADAAFKFIHTVENPRLRERVIGNAAGALAQFRPAQALALLDTVKLRSFQVSSAVRSIFDAWATEDPKAASRAIDAMPAGKSKLDATNMLANRWRETDPKAAYEWLSQQSFNSDVIRARDGVFEYWCAADLDSALERLRAGELTVSERTVVGRAMAERRPEKVAAWISSFDDASLRQQIAGGSVQYLATNTPALAAQLITHINYAARRQLLNRIASAWAVTDFDAARKWVQGIPIAADRKYAAGGLFAHIRESDLASSIKFIDGISDEALRQSLAPSVVGQWADREPKKVTEWINRETNSAVRSSLMNSAMQKLSEQSPAMAAKLIDKYPANKIATHVYDMVVRNWVKAEPTAALKWLTPKPAGTTSPDLPATVVRAMPVEEQELVARYVAGIPDSRYRRSAASAWIYRVAESDPLAALNLIQHPVFGGDDTYRSSSVVTKAVEQDTGAVLKWVEKLPAGRARDYYLRHVVNRVAMNDPKMIVAWIAKQGLEGEEKVYVYQRALSTWANTDPASALKVALDLKPERTRQLVAKYTLQPWISADLPKAIGFVERLKDSEVKQALLAPLSVAIGKDKPAQGIKVAMMLRDPDRVNSLKSLFRQWLGHDQTAAVNWLRGLNDGTLKLGLIRLVSYEMSKNAPEDLVAVGKTLPSGSTRMSTIETGIQAWARKEPAAALASSLELESLVERRKAATSAIRAAISMNRKEISQYFDTIKDPELRFEILKLTLREWFAKQSVLSVDWMLKNLTVEQRAELADNISYASTPASQEALGRFVASLPDAKVRSMLYTVLGSWVRQDADRAIAWLEKLNNPDNREQGLEYVCRNIARTDLARATKLAQQIKDTRRRANVFNTMGQQAVYQPDAGLRWLDTLPEGTNRVSAIRGAMYGLGGRYPQRALAYATNLTDVMIRSNAVIQVVRAWSNSEAESTIRSVLQMKDDPIRRNCLNIIFEQWGYRAPTVAAKHLENLSPELRTSELIWKFIDAADNVDIKLAAEWVLLTELTGKLKERAVGVTISLLRKDKAAGLEFLKKLPPDVAEMTRVKAKRYRLL